MKAQLISKIIVSNIEKTLCSTDLCFLFSISQIVSVNHRIQMARLRSCSLNIPLLVVILKSCSSDEIDYLISFSGRAPYQHKISVLCTYMS